jgi:hypothetical protein
MSPYCIAGWCADVPAVLTEYCPLGSLYDVLKKVSDVLSCLYQLY